MIARLCLNACDSPQHPQYQKNYFTVQRVWLLPQYIPDFLIYTRGFFLNGFQFFIHQRGWLFGLVLQQTTTTYVSFLHQQFVAIWLFYSPQQALLLLFFVFSISDRFCKLSFSSILQSEVALHGKIFLTFLGKLEIILMIFL